LTEFFTALGQNAFLQYALAAGVLCSIACGVVGSYVAARRITYIAGGIAHCILAGMGAARYLQVTRGWDWLHPLYGAVVAALVAATIIGLVSLRFRQREDSVISAVWAIGMAVGVLFIWGTPGYGENLMGYLFGNILMVKASNLWMMAGLDVIVVGIGILFYREFLAVCFDEEFARLRGIPVSLFYLLLLYLTALTVVLLVTVVGLVMVIALLSLPVAIASLFSRTLWQVMVIAALLSMLFTTAGLAVSYGPDLPAGATTIVLTGAGYLVAAAGAGAYRHVRRARQARA